MSSAVPEPAITRRQWLLSALATPGLLLTHLGGLGATTGLAGMAGLAGCASAPPWPSGAQARPSASAAARVRESAQAHGLAAWQQLQDVNLAYAGEWSSLIDRLQPTLADAGRRQKSEERWLPAAGLLAQHHTGPVGHKQVRRQWQPGSTGQVAVWFGGQPSTDRDVLDAAALVCDGYRLFLLGPMALMDGPRDVAWGEPTNVDGRPCDVLHLTLRPGIGLGDQDRVALDIDRQQGLMRRIRFSLDGLASTVGAVAEVDCFDHITRHGVVWPTRFHERLLSPLSLRVHDWRLTGLDVNRGYGAAELQGQRFGPLAAKPAAPLG